MNNFNLQLLTELYFVKDQHPEFPRLIPADTKVLMLSGGVSIKRNRIYDDKVKASL
tara:strand:+ start:1222 stop:1389 length:168 start_codon:yes stop_codon:yes gene_type:complete